MTTTPDPVQDGHDGWTGHITVTTEQRSGITFDQLRQWVQRASAAEVPGDSLPHVRISLGGKLQKIEIRTG